MNDQNTIVQVKLSDYKELEAMANRTTAEVKLLAKKELKKMQEEGAININLRLCSKDWSDEELFIRMEIWRDLSPQLEFMAYKLRNWAHEELNAEYAEFRHVKRLEKQLSQSQNWSHRLTAYGVLGWFLAIVFAVCFIIKVW